MRVLTRVFVAQNVGEVRDALCNALHDIVGDHREFASNLSALVPDHVHVGGLVVDWGQLHVKAKCANVTDSEPNEPVAARSWNKRLKLSVDQQTAKNA